MHIRKTIPSFIIAAAMVFSFQVMAQNNIDTLLDQLSNKAEAPARSAKELSAAYNQALDHLVPQIAAEKMEDRYAPQTLFGLIAAHAGRPGAESERQALCEAMVKHLGQNTPQAARVWMVRQLEGIGGKESAARLGRLLWSGDAEIRECARRALITNPAQDATHALRRALRDAEDASWRIGLISALGTRADADSQQIFAKALDAANPAIAHAAAVALGKVASPAAVRSLLAARSGKTGRLNKAITDALLDAGLVLAARGKTRAAKGIHETLYAEGNATEVRAAALSGIATVDPESGVSKAREALVSGDAALQAAAIRFARIYDDAGFSIGLANALPDLSPALQVQGLGVLADQSAPFHEALGFGAVYLAQSNVAALVNSEEQAVRLAAIRALDRTPVESAVDALLGAMAKGNAEEKAALAALAKLDGQAVSTILRNRVRNADTPIRVAAIKTAAARNATRAANGLLEYAAESNQDVSQAALDALAVLGGDSQIGGLFELMTEGKDGARDALASVCRRAEDSAAASKILVARMGSADAAGQSACVSILPVLAQTDGLEAILKAACSENETLRDAAIRALCDWPTYAATGPLLKIAANGQTELKHNVLALRAVTRLLQLEDVPKTERLDDAKRALEAARRPEETGQLNAVITGINK